MKNYSDALEANAISHRGKGKLSHMRIEKAANGGHVVEHHFQSEGGYREPQQHVFGEKDGKALLAHISKHMGIKAGPSSGEEEPSEGESAMDTMRESKGTAAL